MFDETIDTDAIELLPAAHFDGEIVEIKSYREVSRALRLLNGEKLLGFDTETRPTFTANSLVHHKTALLQIAAENMVFLFRLPYCGVISDLAALLSNPNVVKVGVAVRDDIKGLQEYRSFYPSGFVDLQMMTEPLGIKEKSLKKIAAIVLNIRISKGQQLSNWDNHELTPAQRHYAALDAWACREIYLKLRDCLRK